MIRTAIFAAALLAVAPALAQAAPVGKHHAPSTATHIHHAKAEARVDINTATVEQLMSVKGLSKTQAESIVQGRPFKNVEELTAANILPADVFAMVKDRLTVTK
ncbi:helix-hairpin-helix domain-containing protein [Methylocystis sp. 9N]|uniref:Helix-hairpin-helix domain-containing protein n=1 Tax=Methylocystis borbori TaxID=3118750 RepID=A0ABU7XIU9_9HYPH